MPLWNPTKSVLYLHLRAKAENKAELLSHAKLAQTDNACRESYPPDELEDKTRTEC